MQKKKQVSALIENFSGFKEKCNICIAESTTSRDARNKDQIRSKVLLPAHFTRIAAGRRIGRVISVIAADIYFAFESAFPKHFHVRNVGTCFRAATSESQAVARLHPLVHFI